MQTYMYGANTMFMMYPRRTNGLIAYNEAQWANQSAAAMSATSVEQYSITNVVLFKLSTSYNWFSFTGTGFTSTYEQVPLGFSYIQGMENGATSTWCQAQGTMVTFPQYTSVVSGSPSIVIQSVNTNTQQSNSIVKITVTVRNLVPFSKITITVDGYQTFS